MISVLIQSPGWGGFFMGIQGLLMVVEPVDVFEGVCGFVEVENQAHVSGNGQAPESLQFAFERVQLPARKSGKLIEGLSSFEGK